MSICSSSPRRTLRGLPSWAREREAILAAVQQERVDRTLDLVGLAGYGDRWPYQLSVFTEGIDYYTLSPTDDYLICGVGMGGNENAPAVFSCAIFSSVYPRTSFRISSVCSPSRSGGWLQSSSERR